MKSKKERDEEKKRILNETEQLNIEQQKLADQYSIFAETDALTPAQFKARNLEKEKEILHLVGGGTTSIAEEKRLISDVKLPYQPIFGIDNNFYVNTYRMMRWPMNEAKQYHKRREMALITDNLIYKRFSVDDHSHIKRKNPYVFSHFRKHKNHQFLNMNGRKWLSEILDEWDMMIISYGSDWARFEHDWCARYGIPYQLSLPFQP